MSRPRLLGYVEPEPFDPSSWPKPPATEHDEKAALPGPFVAPRERGSHSYDYDPLSGAGDDYDPLRSATFVGDNWGSGRGMLARSTAPSSTSRGWYRRA